MEIKSIYPAELVLLIFALVAGLYALAVLISPQQPESTMTVVSALTPKPVSLPSLMPAPAHLPLLARNKPGCFRIAALPEGFTACGINNKGEIGGTWRGDPVQGLRNDETRAALWRKGKLLILPAWNGQPSYGSALSDASVVAGSAGSSWSGAISVSEGDAVLWHATVKNSAPKHIGHLPDLSYAELHAVNRRGQAVGFSGPSSMMESREGTQTQNAVFWDGHTVLDLGSGVAYGINERGQVVGVSNGQIALWQEREKRLLGQGEGRAINNRGQIAGVSSFGRTRPLQMFDKLRREPRTGKYRAVYQSVQIPVKHAMLWQRGNAKDLGVLLGATESEAVSINDRSQIVGNCTDPFDYKKQHAFLWQNGAMFDLNVCIPPRSGWVLREARSISNRGRIVGIGTLKGEDRSFLLTLQ